jgi:NAD(P)-dependent dehydrogenase (short-subunit alcohol dehydrogenase family)
MDLKLEGKKALITGGSRGIGRAVAEELAKEKVKVAIAARGESDVKKAIEEIGGSENGHVGISIDLMDEGAPQKLAEKIMNDFGEPEIIVHNLGGSLEISDPFCSVDDWRKVWRFNMEIPIEINNFIIPIMEKKNWGRLIHISSVSGLENLGPIPYCAAKAALTAYSKSLGRVLASKGIVVSAILPGAVYVEDGHWGEKMKGKPEATKKYLKEQTPMHKFAETSEISSLVAFLCSPLASQCAGSVIPIDGGLGRTFVQ